MSHLLSDIYFFKKSNWLFVLTLFGCQKWGFTMEVENWLLLLENPDNKAWVWSCLQLYISCLALSCPPSQVQCRPHKSHQQAVSQAWILSSKMLQCKNDHVTSPHQCVSHLEEWRSVQTQAPVPLQDSVTPVEVALDLVVDENWAEGGVVDPVKLDQDTLLILQVRWSPWRYETTDIVVKEARMTVICAIKCLLFKKRSSLRFGWCVVLENSLKV